MILLINLTTCHIQEASNTTGPVNETHLQRPTTRRIVTRWKASPSSATSNNCEYKDLVTKLHDRINLLVTVDDDLRKRLDTIEKKIVQFESNNLARLDSLNSRQIDLAKRLDATERIQHLTKFGVDQLIGDFEEFMNVSSRSQFSDNKNHTNNFIQTNDLNALRETRQAGENTESDSQMPQGVFSTSESQKLDALATFLASTRTAVNMLQSQLQMNVTKLLQTTGNLQRRFNNLYRRQQAQGSFPLAVPNFYASSNAPQQLTTSCAQGLPHTNNILKLQLTASSDPFYVTCDDELLGGGWTVIMNRFNGDINFQRGWLEYKHGFGNLAGEFFMGLEKLHALTASTVHELLIVLEDFENNRKYARYNLFAIGNEQESYELKLLGKYEGNAGDSFSYHAGSKFSTFDNDNDGCVDCNCAQSHKGGWWYNWCDQSNLMGPYHEKDYDNIEQYRGMYWQDWLGPNYSLKAAKMMIRPLSVEQDVPN